jgi:hypothetical protein
MGLSTGSDFQAMLDEGEDGGKTLFGTALASGQVDD